MQKTLDQVIIDVLNSSSKPLSVKEISEVISLNKLWFRPKDNKLPDVTQISARINNYSQYFTRANGIVTLKKMVENRLCKIVWNSNYWIKPMERSWNPSFANDPNKGYEQKYGFVHEDWLFNPKYIFDGYQYGYIRGVSKLNASVKNIDTIYLFTINPNSKERFYVGKLYDVERLQQHEISKRILNKIKSYEKDMIQELKDVGAEYRILKSDPFVPNLRFKIESKDLFPSALNIKNNWFASKYFRTMPMKMDSDLYSLLDNIENQTHFHFMSSSPDTRNGAYTRYTKEGVTQVEKIHDEIEKKLSKFLSENGVAASKVSFEKMFFGGKLADLVVEIKNNTYDIYEIKTDTDTRRALREAIGQLLDYALWETGIQIRNIYAVVPYVPMSNDFKDFIRRLQASLNLNLNILFYDIDKCTFIPFT